MSKLSVLGLRLEQHIIFQLSDCLQRACVQEYTVTTGKGVTMVTMAKLARY